jgi:2'-5' RNA ligase
MSHRTFIAIDLSEALRERLGRLPEQLAERLSLSLSELRWVPPERLHLTVRFLGDVDDAGLAAICRAAEMAASKGEAFEMFLRPPAQLPGRMTDRMLLAEVYDPTGRLAAMASLLDEALQAAGFAPEGRAFRPHVTLARTKARRGRVPRRAGEALADLDLGRCAVDRLTVYTSELTRQGPIYTPARVCPLR